MPNDDKGKKPARFQETLRPTGEPPDDSVTRVSRSSSSTHFRYVERSRPNVADPNYRTILDPKLPMLSSLVRSTIDGRYRLLDIDQGHGGTFTYKTQTRDHKDRLYLKPPPDHGGTPMLSDIGGQVHFVGTKACSTCVAVYFEINEQRFFFAHINTWPCERTKEITLRGDKFPQERKHLRDVIYSRLKAHAKMMGWTRHNVDLSSLIIACPHPRYAGEAVIDAIEDFLRMKPASAKPLECHGFIVCPSSRSMLSVLMILSGSQADPLLVKEMEHKYMMLAMRIASDHVQRPCDYPREFHEYMYQETNERGHVYPRFQYTAPDLKEQPEKSGPSK